MSGVVIKDKEHLKDTMRYLGFKYSEYHKVKKTANMFKVKKITISPKS